MATVLQSAIPIGWTAADLMAELGGISLERIRMYPPPGMATEEDVVRADLREDRLCELIDGVLVEKTMGTYESLLAMEIAHLLKLFLDRHDLGVVLGADGMLRILPEQVRTPDVCFISWERFADRQVPSEPVWGLAPDLAIEVLSKGNTEAEMQRKLRDYFGAGVRLVWYVDPATRSARAFTAPDEVVEVTDDRALSGGDVLPGLELPLGDLFAKLPPARG
jgi:Uma2 family endonuclease